MTPLNPDQPQHPPASFGHRLIAFLFETVILFVILIVVCSMVIPIIASLLGDKYRATFADSFDSFLSLLFIVLLCTAVIVLVIWGGLLEGIRGRTPGKTVAGLKVISADDHDQTIGFMKGIAREIIRCIPIILYCLYAITSIENSDQSYAVFFLVLFLLSVVVFVLDHLWPLWDKDRQTLHDKIANSHVISKESEIIEQDLCDKRKLPGGLR